jgi:hypothetical protein
MRYFLLLIILFSVGCQTSSKIKVIKPSRVGDKEQNLSHDRFRTNDLPLLTFTF